DDGPTHATLKSDTFPFDVCAGFLKNVEDFWIATELHADLLQNGVRIILDEALPLFAQNIEVSDLPLNIRRVLSATFRSRLPAVGASLRSRPTRALRRHRLVPIAHWVLRPVIVLAFESDIDCARSRPLVGCWRLHRSIVDLIG